MRAGVKQVTITSRDLGMRGFAPPPQCQAEQHVNFSVLLQMLLRQRCSQARAMNMTAAWFFRRSFVCKRLPPLDADRRAEAMDVAIRGRGGKTEGQF